MKSMRGGLRERKKLKRGDQALLQAIWDLHGGPGEVAKKVSMFLHEELNVQDPINWRLRGRVPPKLVKAVAAALKISPLGLNYSTLAHLAADLPSWDDVVKSYGLSKGVTEMILFLKPPDRV